MSDNSFPQRSPSHVIDSRAKTLLRMALPPQWVLRDLTENDYGIDFFLEFTDEKNQLNGQLAAIQLKGTASSSRSNSEESHTIDIKRRTINLWQVYEAPVFVILIDVDTQKTYLRSIEVEKRKDAKRYLLGKTEAVSMLFAEVNIRELTSLHRHYHFAKNLRMMDWALPSIIATHKSFINLFSRYQRDGHMPVDGDGTYSPESFDKHEYERRIRNIYSEMREISLLIGLGWGVPSIDRTIRDNPWPESGSEMYEHHFSLILEQLDVKFQDILGMTKAIVINFSDYWKLRNLEFSAYVLKDYPVFLKLSWSDRMPYLKFSGSCKI